MKKSIALIAVIAALVAPIVASAGIGLNIGSSYTYNLKSQIKNSQQASLAIEFETRGGATFYIQNEVGTWNGAVAKALSSGSQTVHGLGVRVPVADTAGLQVMIGTATSTFTGNGAGGADGLFGEAAGTNYSSTDPIADVGAYVEKTYGDVTVGGDITYRHHTLGTEIVYTPNATDGATRLNNKSGVKAGVRISYGF